MVNKSLDQSFSSAWEKAIAFAQLHGIGADDIIPIYQKDAQQMQQYGYPMSGAERNRALLAAKNPNNVTPVPSDKPNPTSFLGNARADLGNIFTGLAPNHLIPNLFKTAETALVHPSTWIDPIEDVTKGVLTGNEKDITQGLKQAGSSVLGTVVPGVYVLSELASGGIDNVLAHPISSFLDLAPFAPAGRVLSLAMDNDRIVSMAAKLNMTPDQLMKASVPKIGSSFVLSRDVAKIVDGQPVPVLPGLGQLTQGVLVDSKGNPLSVSGLFRQMASQSHGSMRAAADLSAAAFDSQTMAIEGDQYTTAPFLVAWDKIKTDPAKVQAFNALMDDSKPRAPGQMPADIMANANVDPDVRAAYDAASDMKRMSEERAAASGGLLSLVGPTIDLGGGKTTRPTDLIGLQGGANDLVSASRSFKADFSDFLEAVAPASEAARQLDTLRQAGAPIQNSLDTTLTQARGVSLSGVAPERGGVKTLSNDEQWKRITAEGGIVDQALEASQTVNQIKGVAKDQMPDYDQAAYLSQVALDTLSSHGWGRINATLVEHPGVTALKDSLEQYHTWATRMSEQYHDLVDKFIGTDKAQEKTRKELVPTKRKTDTAEQVAEKDAVAKALSKSIASYQNFVEKWWDQPSDKWRSVLYDLEVDRMMKDRNIVEWTADLDETLRSKGWEQKQLDELHSDPTRLAQFIFHQSKLSNTGGNSIPIITEDEWTGIVKDATDKLNDLRNRGYDVEYMPVVSSLNVPRSGEGTYGATLGRDATVRALSSTKARNMTDFMPERHDIVLALHTPVKEALERDITIEFANEHIAPAAMTADEVDTWAGYNYRNEMASLDITKQNVADKMTEILANRMGLVKWDPQLHLGFSFPRWSHGDIYIPAGLAYSVSKLLSNQRFALDGIWDKATNVFRTSILGLSPRYTAHITFGTAFLLALRSSRSLLEPSTFYDAYKMVKEGTTPRRIRQGATERGIETIKYPTLEGGLEAHAQAAGADGAKLVTNEIMDRHNWDRANPIHWAKATAELNFRFTNFVSSFYRAASYIDGVKKAGRTTYYDDEGNRITMTPERAKEEGIKHALKVLGDLKAMTPLERTWMTRIMPFYGWTRHILQYVLTYPVDHPYRAQFLTVQADLDSDSVAKALDTRIQFLYFFGSPDAEGNVKALDVRFLDPLRDVANYASWSGWIGALNPAIEAPLAMIDPNLVYGSTSLYPNVTYDQFYGIETSATQGNSLLTGAEQFVGQIGALDSALQIAGSTRSLAEKDPTAFAKSIYESLNIPFAQVQDINVKQLAAKGEIARYHVAEQAANNAWNQPGMGGSGIVNALQGYASVPNPINPDYEITPQQLQNLYNLYSAAYPGQNPADVVVEPNTPPPSYSPENPVEVG